MKEKNDETTGTMKAVRKADEADCKAESLSRGVSGCHGKNCRRCLIHSMSTATGKSCKPNLSRACANIHKRKRHSASVNRREQSQNQRELRCQYQDIDKKIVAIYPDESHSIDFEEMIKYYSPCLKHRAWPTSGRGGQGFPGAAVLMS